jgi:SsrA-binding protein
MSSHVAVPRWAARCGVLGRAHISLIWALLASLPRTTQRTPSTGDHSEPSSGRSKPRPYCGVGPGLPGPRPYTPAVAKPIGTKLIAENRRARRDYELIERVEAGVVLTGTEVKSARDGHVQLGQAYADVRDGEAWLIGASISEYAQAGPLGHQPDRDRKLLMHRAEIDSLYGKVREKGLTLVPTRMYFKDGRVKVEIALARGRERADKRRVVAERDVQREIERALKRRR